MPAHRHHIVPEGRPAADRILMPAEMVEADRFSIENIGVPGLALMENASRHVAIAAAEMIDSGRPILIVCGGGNNGGDGFGAARHLASWGHSVEIVTTSALTRYRGDAACNLEACRRMGIPVAEWSAHRSNAGYALVVDAVLGTGLKGEVRGVARDAIEWMKACAAPILAVDIPSGVDGATGAVQGAAASAVLTVTFSTSKPGHWLFPGAGHRGALRIVDIGMPRQAVERTVALRRLLGDGDLIPAFRPRPRDAHKGRLGHVYVLGGAVGRTGAVRMCADAAMRAGAGLATIGTTPTAAATLGPVLYEVMAEGALGESASALVERLSRFGAIAVGPGLSTDPAVGDLLAEALPTIERPMVIDADGLNHAVRNPGLLRGAERVITPHPGEAARLLGCTTADVQADRLGAVLRLARDTGAVVVLKGAYTIVQAGDSVCICPDGNPGMATAGMGDVLTGIIAALLARDLDAATAARAAVVWHARSGDTAAGMRTRNHLLARDVIDALAAVEQAGC